MYTTHLSSWWPVNTSKGHDSNALVWGYIIIIAKIDPPPHDVLEGFLLQDIAMQVSGRI